MTDPNPRSNRGLLLIGGGLLIWVVGLMWTLTSKGYIEAPPFISSTFGGAEPAPAPAPDYGDAPVSEIMVQSEPEPEPAPAQRRGPGEDLLDGGETGEGETESEPEGPPTYPVWFESERSIGVCKISYEDGSKIANLHVAARMPAGKLAFSYRCGKYSGQGSIQVKPSRVNGVLFCSKDGDVKVKTVRSKEGRCD